MAKKIVPVYMGGGRMTAVLLRDTEEELTCPWCGADIFIGVNKHGIEMAVEWTRQFGWIPHQQTCDEFTMKRWRCHCRTNHVQCERINSFDEKENTHNADSGAHLEGWGSLCGRTL